MKGFEQMKNIIETDADWLTAGALRFWREHRRWRDLPYVKARWNGPHGITGYVANRDYRVIAYVQDGQLVRGAGESLAGYPMHHETAQYFWTPGLRDSPEVNDQTLIGLLRRCAASPATQWLFARGAAE